MQVGKIKLPKGAALAPMAGATDRTMRLLCDEYGASFTVSEMASAKALSMKDIKSRRLLLGSETQAPYAVQLFGAQPEVMAQAIHYIEPLSFDFLDINMGCPAPKITATGAGSALLKNPILAEQMVTAAVKASIRPVTVKMRIGWQDDSLTGLEVAKRCEQAGASMLCVHARTREAMYTPGVNMDEVAKIKQAVSIPVLYNGDVCDGISAKRALDYTQCDGVMVGRGALGKPWVFADIKATLNGEKPPAEPTLAQKLAILQRQVQGMCEEKGEDVAMRQARGVAIHYMHGLRGASELRHQAASLSYYTDLDYFIDFVLQTQQT